MNYDEQYWRRLAVQAQEQAAHEYKLSRHYAGQMGRVYQGIAYETHQKAMARMHLAEVERYPSVLHHRHVTFTVELDP